MAITNKALRKQRDGARGDLIAMLECVSIDPQHIEAKREQLRRLNAELERRGAPGSVG